MKDKPEPTSSAITFSIFFFSSAPVTRDQTLYYHIQQRSRKKITTAETTLRIPSFSTMSLLLLLLFLLTLTTAEQEQQQQQQPLLSGPSTVSAFPVIQSSSSKTCRLDLSDELFGGVGEACGRGVLDRSRCCPVLAAWLFAAHARDALQITPPHFTDSLGAGIEPLAPDDAQKCFDALQSSLKERDVELRKPNSSCDTVICFCGIRLHEIGSLSCPAAFDVSNGSHRSVNGTNGNATAVPTAAVKRLEQDCRNASYAGCTRCVRSLEKLKNKDGGDRASTMFGLDCQLMGLTWLLAKNKTLYIPTVSAVLRAMLYSTHPPSSSQQYRCSPDQENMPLAVDSLQFQKLDSSSAATGAAPLLKLYVLFLCIIVGAASMVRRS